MTPVRCGWCGSEPRYIEYHDQEWGVPLHDDRGLFELLILEGAQAGLNWLTILKKRQNYRRAFHQFDAEKVARYGAADVERLLQDEGIVRNRLKIKAAINNGRGVLAIKEEFGSLDAYLWRYVDQAPRQNRWQHLSEIPAATTESTQMSRDLKKRGFSFVGPTICYAFMQAAGLVNDHLVDCFRHREVTGLQR